MGRLHLGCTSAAPRLHLGCTSAAPRLHLGCTSAASRLPLGCISAASQPRRRDESPRGSRRRAARCAASAAAARRSWRRGRPWSCRQCAGCPAAEDPRAAHAAARAGCGQSGRAQRRGPPSWEAQERRRRRRTEARLQPRLFTAGGVKRRCPHPTARHLRAVLTPFRGAGRGRLREGSGKGPGRVGEGSGKGRPSSRRYLSLFPYLPRSPQISAAHLGQARDDRVTKAEGERVHRLRPRGASRVSCRQSGERAAGWPWRPAAGRGDVGRDGERWGEMGRDGERWGEMAWRPAAGSGAGSQTARCRRPPDSISSDLNLE